MVAKVDKSIVLTQYKEVFCKPNILIHIINSQELHKKEKRLYNVLLQLLLNQNKEKFLSNEIRTTVTEVTKMLGIKNRSDIHTSLQKLKDTKLKFLLIDKQRTYNYDTSYITGVGRQKDGNKNHLIIEFSSIMTKEILKSLQTVDANGNKIKSLGFTRLNLKEMLKLDGKYSITFYERFVSLLMNFKSQTKYYTESEIREFLNLEDKHKDIRAFNRSVIKASVDELNSKTTLNIHWERGRNSDVYKFTLYRGMDVQIDEILFRDIIRELVYTYNYELTYKHKSQDYVLSVVEDERKEFEKRVLWTQSKSLNIVNSTNSESAWSELWNQYQNKKDLDEFLDRYKILEEEFEEVYWRVK